MINMKKLEVCRLFCSQSWKTVIQYIGITLPHRKLCAALSPPPASNPAHCHPYNCHPYNCLAGRAIHRFHGPKTMNNMVDPSIRSFGKTHEQIAAGCTKFAPVVSKPAITNSARGSSWVNTFLDIVAIFRPASVCLCWHTHPWPSCGYGLPWTNANPSYPTFTFKALL
jgi:hypothetical protein